MLVIEYRCSSTCTRRRRAPSVEIGTQGQQAIEVGTQGAGAIQVRAQGAGAVEIGAQGTRAVQVRAQGTRAVQVERKAQEPSKSERKAAEPTKAQRKQKLPKLDLRKTLRLPDESGRRRGRKTPIGGLYSDSDPSRVVFTLGVYNLGEATFNGSIRLVDAIPRSSSSSASTESKTCTRTWRSRSSLSFYRSACCPRIAAPV